MASKKWWQFWKKEQPPNVVEPIVAAVIPLHFFSKKKPFNDWKPPDTQVPPEHEDFITAMVWGYQLFTYLQLIEAKFGPEITRIIREYQIIALNRLPDSDLSKQIPLLLAIIADAWKTANEHPLELPPLPDTPLPVEVTMALYILITTETSPHSSLLSVVQ